MVINGNPVKIIYALTPHDIIYDDYGIKNPVVIDNTGIWRDEKSLSVHLKSGASKVILTAPAKDNVKNIVYGINDDEINKKDQIISAASCTTNAIVPILKVINDKFIINNGHIETVHALSLIHI